MEYNFADTCRLLADLFMELAKTYEKDLQQIEARLNNHINEIAKTKETKRKILEILQEDLNG